MSVIRTEKNAPASASAGVVGLATPPRLNLNNLEALRRELARLYRDARAGAIETTDASRLAYILGELRKIFEAVDIEKRITELEDSHGN